MITPDPSGWHVAITHPDTGRVRQPEVVDLQNAPVYNPGPNAQPVARIPVAKNDVWLSDAYDADPEMRVWRDGRRLPIEVLRNVEQREGATVLVGVGGVELEGRVTEEYNDDRRHLAVRDLVETETAYGVDAPEPDVTVLEDVVQQDPDTEAEFTTVADFPTDRPEHITAGGVVRTYQHGWTAGSEDADAESGLSDSDGVYSNGSAHVFNSAGDFIEWEITTEYDIPADAFVIYPRLRNRPDDGNPPNLSLRVDGEETATWNLSPFSDPTWFGPDAESDSGYSYSGLSDTLPAGSHTVRIEATNSPGDSVALDAVAPLDDRFDWQFSTDVNTSGGYLDRPGWHTGVDVAFDNASSAFSVTGGSADVVMNDTGGNQRVQISNDNGTTWVPDDGSEQNTASVTVDPYPTTGSGSRLRVTLDGWEPSGAQSQTPRLAYASQELDAYTLRADITQELLLIAETFDNSLASVLSSIGESAERSWGLQTDANGNIVVRFVQNGQFTAGFTPEFSDRTREKLGKTYDVVTVKGSNEPESNVPYTASTSYTALPRNNILTGSETVYDDTTNYERGDDYEMRYRDGEIRATEGGDLEAGTDYRIDFRYQAQGTFTSPDAPADPDELVETVPGVTSTRLAEQVAFVIASEADAPRYAAEVTVPDPDPRFDPTEALPPCALGLPNAADDLEVRGEPQLTEEGLRVRFGTRPSVEQTQQRLSRQLSRVSDRS